MNKQNVIDVLKNIVGIILLLYCIRFGSQFLYAPGVIGIKFDYLQDNYPKILVIDENSPLNETDISINDTILKVNDEDIKDKSKSYVIKKIRGKVNTDVKLTIKHGDDVREYNIKRVKRKIDWFPFN